MIRQIPIHFDNKTKQYYITEQMNCDRCGKNDSVMMFGQHFSKTEYEYSFICFNCFKEKYYKHKLVNSYVIISYKQKLPRGTIPVIMTLPKLSSGRCDGLSVCEAVKLHSDVTKDFTRLAGRDPFFNAIGCKGQVQIGKPVDKVMELADQRETVIDRDPVQYLESNKNVQVELPVQIRGRLTDESVKQT